VGLVEVIEALEMAVFVVFNEVVVVVIEEGVLEGLKLLVDGLVIVVEVDVVVVVMLVE